MTISNPQNLSSVELREKLNEIEDKWATHKNPCSHRIEDTMALIESYASQSRRDELTQLKREIFDEGSVNEVIDASRSLGIIDKHLAELAPKGDKK